MGFRAFGNCLNETVIRPKGGWALAPFFSGGFWNREREGRFCRYTSLSAQDLEWIVVVLCVGRDDRAGQIGVDAALEEGARALKQYALSPGRDPYPLLNRMAASWRQKVEEADWRQNLRLLERYGYTPFAPDFLAVVGTGRETFFVRYGEGCFFYKADGRLQEKNAGLWRRRRRGQRIRGGKRTDFLRESTRTGGGCIFDRRGGRRAAGKDA